ncbi:hypothetical protein KEM55_006213 [Ascosphaera atra]|nr:hypothetical protein KEM55_006213 [Ascosphaera atra]
MLGAPPMTYQQQQQQQQQQPMQPVPKPAIQPMSQARRSFTTPLPPLSTAVPASVPSPAAAGTRPLYPGQRPYMSPVTQDGPVSPSKFTFPPSQYPGQQRYVPLSPTLAADHGDALSAPTSSSSQQHTDTVRVPAGTEVMPSVSNTTNAPEESRLDFGDHAHDISTASNDHEVVDGYFDPESEFAGHAAPHDEALQPAPFDGLAHGSAYDEHIHAFGREEYYDDELEHAGEPPQGNGQLEESMGGQAPQGPPGVSAMQFPPRSTSFAQGPGIAESANINTDMAAQGSPRGQKFDSMPDTPTSFPQRSSASTAPPGPLRIASPAHSNPPISASPAISSPSFVDTHRQSADASRPGSAPAPGPTKPPEAGGYKAYKPPEPVVPLPHAAPAPPVPPVVPRQPTYPAPPPQPPFRPYPAPAPSGQLSYPHPPHPNHTPRVQPQMDGWGRAPGARIPTAPAPAGVPRPMRRMVSTPAELARSHEKPPPLPTNNLAHVPGAMAPAPVPVGMPATAAPYPHPAHPKHMAPNGVPTKSSPPPNMTRSSLDYGGRPMPHPANRPKVTLDTASAAAPAPAPAPAPSRPGLSPSQGGRPIPFRPGLGQQPKPVPFRQYQSPSTQPTPGVGSGSLPKAATMWNNATGPASAPAVGATSSSSGAASFKTQQSAAAASSRPSAGANPAAAGAGASLPLTYDELRRWQGMAKANPSDDEIQFQYAKKLLEAADTLVIRMAGNPKQKAKQRQAYVAEAVKILKKCSQRNNAEAMYYLADCYGQGTCGLQVDTKEAFSLYQSAAKAGHAPSAYRTAVCCELGPDAGSRRDPMKAVQWYRRAASLGDTPAMYKMGMIQLKGLLGQPRNPREAITWLKRAAERADPETPHALHELALLYENPGQATGNVIVKDEAYALELLEQAGNLGYKYSQHRLGTVYEHGLLGTPPDARQSIVWYTRAAAQGEHQSELALSGWYLTGAEGILQQSDMEAYLWARKAALSGLAKAEYAMGYFTEVGIGVPSNLEEAKRWYWKASSHNFIKARERLEDLKRGGAQMEKSKLSRAQQQQNDSDCVVM